MSILNNELVKKYFGDDANGEWKMAYNVLRAMEQPIKKGEKILVIQKDGGRIWEYEYPTDVSVVHPQWLRLPDRFQEKVDPVEAKIEEIAKEEHPYCADELKNCDFVPKLRDLVRLARGAAVVVAVTLAQLALPSRPNYPCGSIDPAGCAGFESVAEHTFTAGVYLSSGAYHGS